MLNKTLQIGAEAQILQHNNNEIVKRRVKKSYRLSAIDDKIRKLRTRSEAKLLEKASKIINVPKVKKVDEKTHEIVMDLVPGKRLSENLNSFPLDKQEAISFAIGVDVAKLHDADIIHGDLTTSNMIYVSSISSKSKKLVNDKSVSSVNSTASGVGGWDGFNIFFIDFGLGYISHKIEDKAVDLHLLKQALEAKHFTHFDALFKKVLRGYAHSKHSKKVLDQFKKVEARGRYKDNY